MYQRDTGIHKSLLRHNTRILMSYNKLAISEISFIVLPAAYDTIRYRLPTCVCHFCFCNRTRER